MVSHFLKSVATMLKVHFEPLSYLSTWLLVAGHSFPWPLPVLYSMTFWWACQSHCHPLNQSDESKNDKHPRQAHQDLESFSGKPQKAPFAWSRVRELQEWGWNCLQPLFLLPHSEGEYVARHHQQSQDEDKYRERLSLWIHSCWRLVPAPFFPVRWLNTGP